MEQIEKEISTEETIERVYDPEFGQAYFSWRFLEYEKEHRDMRWYILAGVVALTLLIYALFTQNFTFAFIIILLAIVYFLFEIHEPRMLTFEITDVGIRFGKNFFPYSEIDKFWILYFPPTVKNLYIRSRSAVYGTMIVPLHDMNPIEIRQLLLNFLQEDLAEEEMPISESIGKILKL